MNELNSTDLYYFNLNAMKINSTHIHNGEFIYSLNRWNELVELLPIVFSNDELNRLDEKNRKDIRSLIDLMFILPTKNRTALHSEGMILDTRDLSKCYSRPTLLNPSEKIEKCNEREAVYSLLKIEDHSVFCLHSEIGSHSETFFKRVPLSTQRTHWLLQNSIVSKPRNILDLGCGSGVFLKEFHSLNPEVELFGLDLMSSPSIEGINFYQDNFFSFNEWPIKTDLVVISEVIEHLEIHQVDLLMKKVFMEISPQKVIVTTPNEIPVKNAGLKILKHPEHVFEWNESQVTKWAEDVSKMYSVSFQISKIGNSFKGLPFFSWGIIFLKDATNEI